MADTRIELLDDGTDDLVAAQAGLTLEARFRVTPLGRAYLEATDELELERWRETAAALELRRRLRLPGRP